MFESQFKRKYKYAQLEDTELAERELLRMLKVIRHLFYGSGSVLADLIMGQQFNQNILQQSKISQINRVKP